TPKRSMGRVAQFDTFRLSLIKIAARVVEMKTMIRVHLRHSCPAQGVIRFVHARIPRLVTGRTGRESPKPQPYPATPSYSRRTAGRAPGRRRAPPGAKYLIARAECRSRRANATRALH